MKAVLRFFTNWWVLSVLIAVVAAIVLVLLLPLVLHFLDPLVWRLVLLGLVIVVWGIAAAWHVFSARRASDHIAEALAKEEAQPGEAATVNRRMADAMARLKHEQGARRDYLYSRPWYVIVGPPGAGKTTAIQNSGLRFPFSEREMKGVGGTRDLDFWFADEAVIVDTAGRYFSQDSAAERDREGWLKFLDQLRRNRPLQPINGVIIAIGVDTLLTADARELDRHTDLIRRRLAELKLGLEVNAPVYVVFTKADRMAGFAEFFDDLDVDQRRAVLGVTLPAENHVTTADQVAKAFDEVVEAVADRAPKRLQDELDLRRRGLVLGFPSQLAGLRNVVTRLLEGAFPTGAREGPGYLRGFYFTSGMQEGGTLDRLLGAAAQIYEAPAARVGPSGRAYFINRLLTEVMFGETGLVQGTAGVRRRRGALLTAGMVTIGVVCAVLLVAWTAGLFADISWQHDVEKQANDVYPKLQSFDLGQVNEDDPHSLSDAAPIFDALRALPDGYQSRLDHKTPLQAWVGMHDGGLGDAANDTYLEVLRRILLPRVLLRLERVQRDLLLTPVSDPSGGDLYPPLKAYLMLGGQSQGHFDAASVQRWVTQDWQAKVIPGADQDNVRKDLATHLTALLADKDRDRVWGVGHPAPVLGQLIAASRNRLATIDVGQRAYAILKSIIPIHDDWTLSPGVLTADQLTAFANKDALAQLTVPFLFTKDGYAAYQAARDQVGASMANESWVLGAAQPTDALNAGLKEVPGLYAADYETQWNRVLAAPQPADYFSNSLASNALLGSANPLKKLLQTIVDQTQLTKTPVPQGGVVTDAGSDITEKFQPLADYVASHSLDGVMTALRTAVGATTVVSTSNNPAAGGQQVNAAAGALTAATLGAPPQLTAFVQAVANRGQTASTGASIASIRNFYAAQAQACMLATRGFPFDASSPTDAKLSDVVRMFGQGGPLDQVTAGLSSYVDDRTAQVWHWNAQGAAASLDSNSADSLRQAQQIEALLGPGGVALSIANVQLGAGVTQAQLKIGDTVNVLTPGQATPLVYKWSSLSTPAASLTVTGTQPVTFTEQGDFAMFRLFHDARKVTIVTSNPQGTVVQVQFGGGDQAVSFTVTLPAGIPDPFVGATHGPWAFRCPATL